MPLREDSAPLHFHVLGPSVQRAQVRGQWPKILGRGSEVGVHPSRTLGTFSFSSQLRGFPGGSSIGPAAGRNSSRRRPQGCGHEDPGWPWAPGVPGEGTGRQGRAQRATSGATRNPRAVNPANESQLSACSRAVGDCRATERGRLAESRAMDEVGGRLGAEVREPQEAAGRAGRQTELTVFDRSQSCGKDLVAMELGELLYNKSEYIETVRMSRRRPASLRGRCPHLVPAPPGRVPVARMVRLCYVFLAWPV